jgi:putative transposase
MIRNFKFRLYPSQKQINLIENQLNSARFLYNSALQERRDAYQMNRISISYQDQANQLKEIRANGHSDLVNFSSSQKVLRRLDKAFSAFFRRIKKGDTHGFPRFKGKSFFNSLEYTYSDGCKLKNNKLYLQGIGNIKIKLHRDLPKIIKTLTIKKEADKYYAVFSCEIPPEHLPKTNQEVGIDVGIKTFAYLSDGIEIDNFKYYESSQKKLRRLQRSVARKKKGSANRKAEVKQLRNFHNKIFNRRSDFQHKISHWLVNQYDYIALEDLNIKGLSKGKLSKQILDASWGSFTSKLICKAENAGKTVVKVNPRNTSQNCSSCGIKVPKDLSVRIHDCPSCGLVMDRDLNAAKNILRLGRSLLELTWSVTTSVSKEAPQL